MQDYFIPSRAALDDAVALVEEFGTDAPLAAAMRAEQSRDVGNVGRFCHWRQIERVTEMLSSGEVDGSIH